MLCGLGRIEFVSNPVWCVFMHLLSFVMAVELLHENKYICVSLLSCVLAMGFDDTPTYVSKGSAALTTGTLCSLQG